MRIAVKLIGVMCEGTGIRAKVTSSPCSSNSSQRECKYKSVPCWEMRVVTPQVSGQSVSNSPGSSDGLCTCSRYIGCSSSRECWCVLQQWSSKPGALWKLGASIEIHEPYKWHVEHLLCSSAEKLEQKISCLWFIYLASKIAEKKIRRQISILKIARQFSSSSKKGKSEKHL